MTGIYSCVYTTSDLLHLISSEEKKKNQFLLLNPYKPLFLEENPWWPDPTIQHPKSQLPCRSDIGKNCDGSMIVKWCSVPQLDVMALSAAVRLILGYGMQIISIPGATFFFFFLETTWEVISTCKEQISPPRRQCRGVWSLWEAIAWRNRLWAAHQDSQGSGFPPCWGEADNERLILCSVWIIVKTDSLCAREPAEGFINTVL